jgi:ABC-2 type transport system permease protein
LNAFINHFSFEFRTGVRNKTLLLMNYLLPLGFYAMMGLVMTEDINPLFAKTMIPAMVMFAILAGTLLGLPDPLVNAREAGIFRGYKINGVPAISILSISALTTIFHTIISALIIIFTAPVFFHAPKLVNWPGFALTLLLFAFACAGLGVLIGVLAANSRITVIWSQLIFLPSMLLSGMMLPYDMLPKTVGRAARLLPATHAMNAFRALGLGLKADFDPMGSMIVLLSGGILAFTLAVALFSWDSKNTTRRIHPALALLVLLPYAAGVFLC